jgi:uncharacterized protein
MMGKGDREVRYSIVAGIILAEVSESNSSSVGEKARMQDWKKRLEIDLLNSIANLANLCQRYHVRKLALFGSILRDDFNADSDLDILVEFEHGYTPGFGFIDLQDELSQLFKRQVDLNTPQCLSRYFRDRVLAEAQTLYVFQ